MQIQKNYNWGINFKKDFYKNPKYEVQLRISKFFKISLNFFTCKLKKKKVLKGGY